LFIPDNYLPKLAAAVGELTEDDVPHEKVLDERLRSLDTPEAQDAHVRFLALFLKPLTTEKAFEEEKGPFLRLSK
jgi:hypothetical protein